MPRNLVFLIRFSIVGLLLAFAPIAHSKTDPKEASVSPLWLRLYQYVKKGSVYVSDVTSERYFFSPEGRRDPLRELEAAITAFEDPSKKFGTQKDSAACVFPYRKRVLEDLLGRTFPSPKCTDLENWVARIDATRVSLVFVGAYPGNPASILGHSFLRLSNSAREDSGREGVDLLSYSIGFMAQADANDNRMTYMLKGLTGGYPGFYEIEPHYMKVGLYNNSESRDLWDLPLSLSPIEVDSLVRHYWELTFNASFDYFFIDENCSYRLLTLIEAVRPDLDLTSRSKMVVLPAETVRTTIESGIAAGSPKFRPSVKRRMEYKLSLLDADAHASFERGRSSIDETKAITDPTAIDALLDHWIYENYKVKTELDDRSRTLMEATYARASELRTPSKFMGVTNESIRESATLAPPYSGHEPAWVELRVGIATGDRSTGGITYRSGAHPFWSGDRGYDDISGIEYLGFDVDATSQEKTRWSLLLAKATAFENFFSVDRNRSWLFEAKLDGQCTLCGTTNPSVRIDGGYGIGVKTSNATATLLARVKAASWMEEGAQGLLAPGLGLNLKLRRESLTLTLEPQIHWWRDVYILESSARLNWATSTDTSLFVLGTGEESKAASRTSITAGIVRFF